MYAKTAITPLRPKALRAAEKWCLDHMEGSEGLGAIFPPMVYILIVFKALGIPGRPPTRWWKLHRHLRELFIREEDTIRIQPCHSPVWDTGIGPARPGRSQYARRMEEPGSAGKTKWLLDKECRVGSDWMKNCPGVEPSGWYFEFLNPHYPDVDDTAMVAMALKRAGGAVATGAIERGIKWLLAMQNDNGGWAAFDHTKSRPILEHVPFADHNAMQDPSCPDITGRTLECLGHCGLTIQHPAGAQGVGLPERNAGKRGLLVWPLGRQIMSMAPGRCSRRKIRR